jgi:hypothetical protein
MLNRIIHQRWGVYVCLIWALALTAHAGSYGGGYGGGYSGGYDGGQRRERPPRNGTEVRGAADPQTEQLRQQAQGAVTQINQTLKVILEQTRQNQRPGAEVIENADAILEQSKRYATVLDDKQKADFMLLQAWTKFYQKNPVEAVNWSMRACKANEASQDGWISQALFCLLYDKRPMKPRFEKPRLESQRRPVSPRARRGGETMMTEAAKPTPFSEKGVLEFDLMGLRDELLREQFSRLEFQTASGKKVEYKPGADVLCMLIWQQGDASDANDLRDRRINGPEGYGLQELNMEPDLGTMVAAQNTDIESQRNYLKILAAACRDHPDVKFVQINADAPDTATKVAEELAKDPHIEEAGPLVFAADPASNAGQFTRWNSKKPFMVIANKEGKIKYAGTAADFVPAFILTELTGIPIALEKKTEQGTGLEAMSMMMDPFGLTPTDPNARPVDPNAVPNPLTALMPEEATYRQLPLEEEVQAEKEMVYARDLFMELGRKRGMTYTNGVKLCREIIRKYPGTQYEQDARVLLRQVPENQRAQYQITNSELGL